ncbi:MAG: putative transmembrane protein [Candidatus Peregrinibacteria bacterium Greene0416_19]|nr:MAG: putative transmembrane protein [Candidatus Peregrinibacteria bacterium Greene0416_19]
MPAYPIVSSAPLTLSPSTEGRVYGLFGLAIGLTLLGVWLGIQYMELLLGSGVLLMLLLVELGIVFTSGLWSRRSPLNYLLFGLFPVLSGLTLTPYLLAVVAGYVNGSAILLNALAATAFMAGAAAVVALTSGWNLSVLGRSLFFALLGLIGLGILQVFVPSFRTGQFELLLSGAGVALFAVFTAYDIQRIAALSRTGANPFQLALSLYLDIYNLFLYVVRFMLALSGRRD